jgi:pilus assembly protein Flp/PilA
MTATQRFCQDEGGATAIEYGLMAGLVCVAIISALNQLGAGYNTIFSKISSTYAAAAAK